MNKLQRQQELLDDAIIIYRLIRNPEPRSVFYINRALELKSPLERALDVKVVAVNNDLVRHFSLRQELD